MNEVLDAVWKRVVGGLDWLKQVVFGEFEDNRDMSAVVADMLVSFVPGVVIVTSARDLTAVIVRLAKKPERREQVEEWMLVIACAVPLVLPILAAAAGAAAVGVGAIIGGIGGSEAGAALRATCLLLIKQGGRALAEIVGFLRRFIKGDILKVLRDIRFVKYGEALVKYVAEFIGKLIEVIGRVRAELLKLDAFHWLAETLRKLEEMERAFYGVQQSAVKAIPRALAELDARLQHALAEALPHSPRPAAAGIPARMPDHMPATPQRVPASPGNPLGTADGTRPAVRATPAKAEPNVHPEHPREPRPRLVPGTPEHKADRWARYQAKGGKKSYEEWSRRYDANMRNYRFGAERESAYRAAMGAEEGTLKTPLTNRQIDILNREEMYAGQLKTGPVSLNEENARAIAKDAELVKRGWQVEHILEQGASKPYLDALERAGIDAHIGPKIP